MKTRKKILEHNIGHYGEIGALHNFLGIQDVEFIHERVETYI